MYQNSECQLYKYNSSFYLVKKETGAYFAKEFLSNELDEDHVAWLNFYSLSDKVSIITLCQNLSIDIISVENIFLDLRRPKVEENTGYIFFKVISALPNIDDSTILHNDQITFFLSDQYLISFQESNGNHFDEVRDRIEKNRGKIRSMKSDFLLYRALEGIVDNYFDVLDSISQKVDRVEEELHITEDKSILMKIETEKRKLIELKKIATPMLDIANQLVNSDSPVIDKSTLTYFNSLYNSCSQVITEIESQKQILDSMANFYYAAQGQRMNEIMKVLTIVSSIFIPLTFIAGVYGMNFTNMPELDKIKHPYAYTTVLGVMFVLAVSLFAFFVSKGWLKKKDYTNQE